jgi:hypothetical protein
MISTPENMLPARGITRRIAVKRLTRNRYKSKTFKLAGSTLEVHGRNDPSIIPCGVRTDAKPNDLWKHISLESANAKRGFGRERILGVAFVVPPGPIDKVCDTDENNGKSEYHDELDNARQEREECDKLLDE